MNLSACNYCGSKRLRADRSLGGKLICSDCGKTISNKKQYLTYNQANIFKNNNVKYIAILLLIIILVVLIG